MSFDHNSDRSPSGKSKKRGSVKNADRLADFGNRTGQGSAEWASCDEKWLKAVVVAITTMGGAITVGLSRDQGAHFLTLMLDDSRKTLWYNGDSDLNEELRVVHAMLDAMT